MSEKYVGSKAELRRLIDLIPNTDPRSHDYTQLLQNIESLSNLGFSLDELLAELDDTPVTPRLVDTSHDIPDETPFQEATVEEAEKEPEPKAKPKKVEPKEEPKAEPKEEPKAEETEDTVEYTPMQIRTMLATFRRTTGISIPQLLQDNFGVDSFGAVPAKSYGKLAELIEKLTAEHEANK